MRPQTLNEFKSTSNQDVIDRLRIAIASAKKRNKSLSNILLYGSAGLGKTSLSHVIANEMNAKLITRTGGSLTSQKDVFQTMYEIQLLLNDDRDVMLFIDEIHKLAVKDMPEELFYSLLEDFVFYSALNGAKILIEGEKKIITSNEICFSKPITFIAATTSPGLLNKPLRDRFQIHCYLKEYSIEDLIEVLSLHAKAENISISDTAKRRIAERARGVPRIAIGYLMNCRDRTISKDLQEIAEEIVEEEMKFQAIDNEGLTQLDMKVLKTLSENEKGLGLQNLAGTCNIDKTTLSEMVLPFLQFMGYAKTTNKRFITERGIAKLKGVTT